MRLKYIYLGIASFLVTFCLVLTLVIPAFDKRFDVFNLYSKPRQELKPLAENDSAAYDFWYPPANSFGMGIQKTVNWTYWKQWLNNSFYWTSQRSTNKVSWTDASSYLKVNTKYNTDNGTAKISIVLNTTGADQNYYYRFMLNCNESLRQMVNHSSLYEYVLTLPCNMTEDYNITYNFSDLKPLLQQGVITVNSGVTNNIFWSAVSTVTRIQPNRLFTIDPTFGYTSATSSAYIIELKTAGTNDTAPSSGTADNITVMLKYITSNSLWSINCSLYTFVTPTSSTPFILATTGRSMHVTNTFAWYVFTFPDPKPSIIAGHKYSIFVQANNSPGTIDIAYDALTGRNFLYSGALTYCQWPDPLVTSLSLNYVASIYCSYTPTSSKSWHILSNTINGSIYNSTISLWHILSNTINGSIYNSSINSWHVISNTINGSIYNLTGSWKILSNTINGSIYNNSGLWKTISNTINGSIYNKTGTWKILSNTINGSIYNISMGGTWHIISNSINGSIYNSSVSLWHILSNTINGSIYNVSMGGTWHIISNTINGSIFNMTYPWHVISSSINGSIYNASSPDMIQITNPKPSNNSLQWPINVTLSVTITHLKKGNMNITWYWGNSTANATHYLGSTVNVGNGTYYMHIQPANVSFTNFSWKVYVNSGSDSAQSIFKFKTSTKSILFLGTGARDRFALGLTLGGMLFFVIGIYLWKRKT